MKKTTLKGVRYSYLPQQFEDCEELWQQLREFVKTGDFTLGRPLIDFETNFSSLIGTKYAIGVNSGTDAIKLSLKAMGVGIGDEVITSANTFVATVGAIMEIGATPVFVDCDDTFCMNVDLVKSKISEKTKAIVPVHYTGYMTDMRKLLPIAKDHNLLVVEDACQSILGAINNKNAGTWGKSAAFSLHPLKNINVWADGGVIVTDDEELEYRVRLLRNHGLVDRDTVVEMGYNSRLDTIQAVVGNWLLPKAEEICNKRIQNAYYYDKSFSSIKQIDVPPRPQSFKIVYHLYIVFAENRDELLQYCLEKGIEAKVHYPIPIYRQPALQHLGFKKGDFPISDSHTTKMITFPCDQHLEKEEMDYIIETVKSFYGY